MQALPPNLAVQDDCPRREELQSFVRGTLAVAVVGRLIQHLAACQRCETALPELLAGDSLLAELRKHPEREQPSDEHQRSLEVSTTPAVRALLSSAVLPLNEAVSGSGVLGHYRLLERIGKGGMGVVYKALDVRLKRAVALKLLHCGGLTDEAIARRFRTEAEAIARLEHPHIVRIYEAGEFDGTPFFSMELMPGSLAQKLNGKPIPEREAAQLVETLALAVQFAHERQVLHRDLKPANILLSGDDTAKLTDFGLAKLLDAETDQTHSGAVIGTPSYMAPEQARGDMKNVGVAADVYSLGAILYELLTGQPPFRGGNKEEILERVRSQEPTPPSRLRKDLSRNLEAICLKCLEKETRRRYPSAQALAEDLAHWSKGLPTVARPPRWSARIGTWLRRRSPAVVATVTTFLLAMGSLAAWWYFDPDRPLRKIEAELAAGHPQTLLGKTGQPAWMRWQLGAAQSKVSQHSDGSFSVHSWEDVCLLELLSNPQTPSFRIHAQIRHENSHDFGEVGLFCCHEEIPLNNTSVHNFICVAFNDVIADTPPPAGILPPGVSVPSGEDNSVMLAGRIVAYAHDRARWDDRVAALVPRLFKPAGYVGGDWRDLVIEVTTEGVAVLWEQKQSIGPLSRGNWSKEVEDHRRNNAWAQTIPAARGQFRCPAQGSVGLYLVRGTASFRTIVIEPINNP